MTVVPFLNPNDFARVERRVKKLWNEGLVQFIEPHCTDAMRRRSITALDIQAVLRTGRITEHMAAVEGIDYWRFTFQGRDTEGHSRKVVVEVNGKLLIVTVY